MVLFKFEMKRNLKSLIIWSIILASLIMMLMSMYSQTTMEQQALNEKM